MTLAPNLISLIHGYDVKLIF